ncbi:alpha/beta fold hydrolase [Amycolatopsis rubida]|uniref:Lysophospholipase, alpha-beta hydrolase superfamily n=1 Tax=Amycolatopsis rubida TaxID=112413 RepID=A0A1I5XJ94_9PSEU|nr:alpha/beta fold hydrolase [Amycolatopsis rubida]SFQ32031.1 Lysophospholipase, alpha-beta hydrolase superfamily [Amycolatopsis rubida]
MTRPARDPGTPLILLHGLGADHRQVENLPWGDALAGRTVLAPDLHGDTGVTFDSMAAEVRALAERTTPGQAAVVLGISMGAGVALRLALRHPAAVRAAICVRPAWLHRPHPPNLDILRVLARHLEHGGRDAFADCPPYRTMHAQAPHAARALLAHFDAPDPHRLARLLRTVPASAPYPLPETLADIDCPVLVLGNDEDPLHPLAIADTWAAKIPRATTAQLPPRYRSPDRHAQQLVRHALAFIRET